MARHLRRKHLLLALMLPFLAALLLTAATTPLPSSADDVSIAKSIHSYLYGRSEILRLRVDSISINRSGGEVDEGTYRSTWEVTLRFRADYARPEEDPYLAGMIKCLNELKAGSDAAWIKWAEDEIDKRRSEVRDLISYVQEREEKVTAYAEIDRSGRILPETIKLQVEGIEGAHRVQDLLKAVPGPEIYEDAGYKYLLDERESPGDPGEEKQESVGASGHEGVAAHPKETQESKGEPGPPPSAVPVPPAPTEIKPTTRRPAARSGSNDSGRAHLIYWAMGLISLLLLILIASEVHNQRRKQSGRR